MPLKNTSSATIAGGGEPPYDGGMEHRMTTLEIRFDIILPTLATKADVEALRADNQIAARKTDAAFAEMRADMQKMNAEIKSWTLATMLTIVGTMLAAIFGISQIYKGAAPVAAVAPPAPIIITIPSPWAPVAPVPQGAK